MSFEKNLFRRVGIAVLILIALFSHLNYLIFTEEKKIEEWPIDSYTDEQI